LSLRSELFYAGFSEKPLDVIGGNKIASQGDRIDLTLDVIFIIVVVVGSVESVD
jgi:hypothetical protein